MGGKSDFHDGYTRIRTLRRIPSSPYPVPLSNGPLQSYSDDALKKIIDTEPDIYSYSFPGHSGKFVFDSLGVARMMPYESLHIAYTIERAISNELKDFTITDEAGNSFFFTGGESTEISHPVGCGPVDGATILSGPTGYFLTRIITPYQDTVKFSYKIVSEVYNNPIDLTEYEVTLTQGDGSCKNIYPPRNCISRVEHRTQVLQQISCRKETVDFTYANDRQDLTGNDGFGSVRLTEVAVKYAGVVQKQFKLYHSYFGTPTTAVNLPAGTTPQDYVRLRLDSVRQVGLPAYHFSYQLAARINFPPINSYAQDLWGYYNNQSRNQTLIVRPNHRGANRDSDSTAMTLGMLRQITYPTGGTSTFTYEANTVYYPQRFANTLETIGQVLALSTEGNSPVQSDTVFTIPGDPRNRRKVSVFYRFPDPTRVNTGGGSGGSGDYPGGEVGGGVNSGGTVSGGSARITLRDAITGHEYYSATSGVTSVSNVNDPIILSLPCGTTYRLSAFAVGGFQNANPGSDPGAGGTEYYGSLTVQAQKIIPAGNQVVGGCRIKQITHNGLTSFGQPSTTYYQYDSLGISSGYLLSLPQLTSRMQRYSEQHGELVTCTYNVYMQNSVNQVGLTSGCVAAYPRVTTLTGPVTGATTHKSIYYYNSPFDDDDASNQYPFPPPTSFEWLRGKLIREQDFINEDRIYTLAREKKYTYQANATFAPGQHLTWAPYAHQAIITGYRVFTIASGQIPSQFGDQDQNLNAIIAYHYYSASVYLTKTEETLYKGKLSFTTVKLFDYNDDNLLPTRERTTTSAGDTLTKFTYYHLSPALIPPGTANPTLKALQWEQQHHILNRPVETAWYRYRKGVPPLALKRSLTLRQLTQQLSLPLREYVSQGGTGVTIPISYEDFGGDSLRYDASYYPVVAHQRYDASGNVQQQLLPSGRPVAYQYGYRQKLLTAHAVNASWAQLASTSFEEEATGRWRYDSTGTHRVLGGRTGHWAYLLDGTTSLSRGQLPAGNYEFACWVQAITPPQVQLTGGSWLGSGMQPVATTVGNWRQFRGRFHIAAGGQVQLNKPAGSSPLRVDDVCLWPVGSQLTTYTHDPLVGETSVTGPDGRTTFYEYDGLGRLVRTRDEQGRILSQQQYHYAGK